jgi:tetratricopeptide (TPR) repeat protein
MGYLRSFALLLSAVLIAVLIRPVISEYYATRQSENPISSTLKASRITNEDARYHYLLGFLYQKRNDDNRFKNAIESYRRSLERDPTRALTWLALSKAYAGCGDQKWAEYAIRRAASVDRANPKIIWEAGMFYLTEGDLQETARYFRHYLLLMPSEQENVYTMLHAAEAKPAFMLARLLPPEYQFYSRYFKFLMTYKQSTALSEVWGGRNLWKPANADYLTYCDFLIDTGRLREAQDVWTEFIEHVYPVSIVRDSSNMIFNGGFEYPLQDGGFDWKTGNADGVQTLIDKETKKSGRSSLAARFSGKTNPGIYIAQQVVAVEPKQRYRLLGQIRTDRLTTHNGILLEVLGQNCPSLAVRSEVVTGTNDWRPLELEFTTPAACSLIKIGIKRERSEKFDNKISGDVWLDDFTMQKVTN